MPIISLLTPPTLADADHQVAAPGGYEWWRFDAEDQTGDLRMVAIFFQGFVFHPAYVRAYGKYRRRPTRNAPPLPAQFPCVYFSMYRGSEIVGQFISQYPAENVSIGADRIGVSLGSNQFSISEDGSLQLQLNGVAESRKISATFRFMPRVAHQPVEKRFFSRIWSGADHSWVIANPLCDVSGEVEISDSQNHKNSSFSMKGLGYHDHNYGTGPIGPGLKRWMCGRVLMEDHAAMFQYAQPRDANQPDDVYMVEADAFAMRELPVGRFNADWSVKSSKLLRYPAWVEAGAMQLVNPKVIDSSPYHLRLVYDASVRGANGKAFCEVTYPHRLRWPILGRMIEKTILTEPGHVGPGNEDRGGTPRL
jgi:carotenoid 1,2-hydratase